MEKKNLVLYFKNGSVEVLRGVEGVREVKDRITFFSEKEAKEFQMQDIKFFMELEKVSDVLVLCNALEGVVQEIVEERMRESAQKIFTMGMLAAYTGMGRM